MKIKALAALLASCCAIPALAQSSVTMYGLADMGINISSLGGNDPKVKIASGMFEGSRIGFKGNEDLGGGYRAIFVMEARVEMDTGRNSVGNLSTNTGYALTRGMESLPPTVLAALRSATNPAVVVNTNNAIFDRTSMVGLVTPVGGFLLGRQYTPVYELFVSTDAFAAGTAGSWGWVNTGLGGLLTAGSAIRSDKALQYRIEDRNSGFKGALMYGFDKSGYIGLDRRFWAFNIMYTKGDWDVGVAHNHGTDQTGNSGLITSLIGGSYKTGDWKFFFGYQKMKNENSVLIPVLTAQWDAQIAPGLVAQTNPATAAALRNVFTTNLRKNFYLNGDSYALGVHYKVGAGVWMGQVSHQNDKAATNSDTTLYAVGYDHFLSPRTDLYSVFGYQKNSNYGQYAPGIAAAAGGFTGSPGESAKVLQMGIRHKF